MGTIEWPPLYTAPVHPGCLGTKGGPRIDADGRVLDVRGRAIPGLYGAGNVVAGLSALRGSVNVCPLVIEEARSDMTFDETFDLVVIGSGGGSMCAAVVAADAGQSVVVLEKQDKVGGSSGYSGGVLYIPNNPLMAEEGVADSPERAREYFDGVVTYDGPGTTPERRDQYIRSGAEMVNFLRGKGVPFMRPHDYSDYYDELAGRNRAVGR